jgi:hypothetical protein
MGWRPGKPLGDSEQLNLVKGLHCAIDVLPDRLAPCAPSPVHASIGWNLPRESESKSDVQSLST